MQSKRVDATANCSLHVLGFAFADFFCSEKRTVFREQSSRKAEFQGTDNVYEQMSERIFKVKWRLLRSLSFNYFAQHAGSFETWGIPVIPLDIPQFGGIFSHVTCLDQ